jgi:hypothetical protein
MPQKPMRAVATAYGRALMSQLSGKMLLLSFVPVALSLVLWGGVLYLGLQPLIDYVQNQFSSYDLYATSGQVLSGLGLGMLRNVVVPLIAMLLLLPLMILSSLLFMGVAAMPAIVRHVERRSFSTLEKRHGGGLLGSLLTNLTGFGIFLVIWVVTLPLYAVAPVALLVQVALWGWLTARVMTYDALAEHASAEERAYITRVHKRPLLIIGMVSGALGALPGIVWVGGAVLSVVLFPFLAIISIWLYVLIFIFTGLWFQYYCLQALADLRAASVASDAAAPFVAQ